MAVVVLWLSAVGFADDYRGGLPAKGRLLAQCAAGLVASIGRTPSKAIFAGAAVPAVVNVVNFMDGINGISGSTALLWGSQATCLGVREGMPELAVCGALAAGGGAGFLPWNLPSGQIFLGAVGSYHFGGLIAAGLIEASEDWPICVAAVSPLCLYLADTTQAIVRRKLRGQRLMEPHRDHIYQILANRTGLSHSAVTALHSGLALGISAAWLFNVHPIRITIGATVCYLSAPRLLGGQ